MRVETLELLQKLQRKYGIKGRPSGSFGKIVQKLLALAFFELGFINIVERGVQGVDIDVTSAPNQKLAFEVKTTEKLSIILTADNVQALRDRVHDGYQPVLAILRLAPLENWVFAKIPDEEIPTGDILIEKLRQYRMKDLENKLLPKFDIVTKKHFKGVWDRGEQYLKEQLRIAGIITRDNG
jgi:Holliday junction resolvase